MQGMHLVIELLYFSLDAVSTTNHELLSTWSPHFFLAFSMATLKHSDSGIGSEL
jgi:hypothetical protein